MFSKLVEISRRMKGQDNRCTSNPIFYVQDRERIYGMDTDYSDNVVWIHCDGFEVDEDDEDLAEDKKYYEENGQEPPVSAYTRTAYIDIWSNKQPFFSEKEAEAYIRANRHHLTDPRIYVDSAYRNYEWQAVLEVLNTLENHVTEEEWEKAKEHENPDEIHPCSHWFSESCDCEGSCSCHWVQKKEE